VLRSGVALSVGAVGVGRCALRIASWLGARAVRVRTPIVVGMVSRRLVTIVLRH